MSSEVALLYGRYIACLNAREWERLGEFVSDEAVHNGRLLGVHGYRAMLEENCRDIPDLFFHVEFLLSDDNHIASRIRFDCTPVGKFLDLSVEGRRVVFHEHAFYTLEKGKILDVLSIVDKIAIEAQLKS